MIQSHRCRPILVLGLVIALSLICQVFSLPEDCSSPNDDLYTFNTKYGHFMYRENVISTWPRNPATGELVEGGRIEYHLNSILEVPIQNVSGSPVCQKFKSFSFTGEHPEQWASLPHKELNMTDSTTTCTRERKTISIGPNVTADAIVVTVTSTLDPSMTFNVTFAVSNTDKPVTVKSFDPQFSTANRSLSFQYVPDAVKLTFELENWTWQFEPGWSQIILGLAVSNRLYSVDDPWMAWDFTSMNMTVMMGMNLTESSSMMVEVVHDLSAVLDGVPYVLNPTGTETEITVPGMIDSPPLLGAIPEAYFWLPFCSTPVNLVGRRFNHLWYDPSISVVFQGALLSPDASPADKSDKTKFIILAVCLVAVVILLITGFLIAWFNSSSLRTFFRPYRKRKLGGLTREDATKPTSID